MRGFRTGFNQGWTGGPPDVGAGAAGSGKPRFFNFLYHIIFQGCVGYDVFLAMDSLDALMESEDATWREILYSVLKDLNPWDVDVVELATRYSLKVDDMREMNFRIPANVVLVCSVLLRMKADILTPKPNEYFDYSTSLDFIFSTDYPIAALLGGDGEPYPIAIKPARVLTRKVTANELIEAIQDALAEKTRLIERATQRAAMKVQESEEVSELVLETDMNILEVIEETYRLVMDILSGKEVVLFSDIAKTKDEILQRFISLLHLSNSQRVTLTQEQLFGEIYIRAIAN
jgi:segregation and condensation protein A